jgi:hypothetical protein
MGLSKDLVAASATPLVLAILAEGESYGYAIIKRVSELSGGQLQWTDGRAASPPSGSTLRPVDGGSTTESPKTVEHCSARIASSGRSSTRRCEAPG